MYPHVKGIVGVAVIATLALPGTALAHERPSIQDVKSHVRSADQALTMVSGLVQDRDQAAAAVAFARNRTQMHAADRDARRLAGRDAARGARALRLVVSRQDATGDAYVDLVDEASGDVQVLMAKAGQSSLKARDRAVAQLSDLLDRVPSAARASIARSIAAVAKGGTEDITAIGAAIEAPTVSDDAEAWLELALAQATVGMNTAVAQLQSLVGSLPAPARAHVQSALDQVSGALTLVTGILQGIFGGAQGEPTGGIPIPSGLPIPQIPLPSGLPVPIPIG